MAGRVATRGEGRGRDAAGDTLLPPKRPEPLRDRCDIAFKTGGMLSEWSGGCEGPGFCVAGALKGLPGGGGGSVRALCAARTAPPPVLLKGFSFLHREIMTDGIIKLRRRTRGVKNVGGAQKKKEARARSRSHAGNKRGGG